MIPKKAKRMKNGYFLHLAAQKHRQAQVNVVHWKIFRCCGKRCILMVTRGGDRRKDDNSQQFSRPAAESKTREPRVNVPRAESVKNYCQTSMDD